MTFEVIDSCSVAGGAVNEDRAGLGGGLAWIIDGATDVVAAPLTGAPSDASWLAGALHDHLRALTPDPAADLRDVVTSMTAHAADAFGKAAKREPAGRHEHPSAAGIVVRAASGRIDLVALGDCAIIAGMPRGEVACRGIGVADAGDAALAAAIRRYNAGQPQPSAAAARRHIWPQVIARRAAMNTPGGYGIFSITPVPDALIATASFDLAPGARILLVTDGLARLVDVFQRYTPATLLAAACSDGLGSLASELRSIEADDRECARYPRAKPHDDATGLLLAMA